jgi:hypothetical protein
MEMILSALGGSAGAVAIFFIASIVIAAIRTKSLSDEPRKFMLNQGYEHGKYLRGIGKRFFNQEQLKEFVEYSSDLPDCYDKGFDAGLLGDPKPEIEP